MKKLYKSPEMYSMEMESEELLQDLSIMKLSDEESTEDALSKERGNVNFSDDESIW